MHIFHCWHKAFGEDGQYHYDTKRTKCKVNAIRSTGRRWYMVECCICGKRKKKWESEFCGYNL